MNKKISPEEFVRLAIQKLRSEPYKGIHSVYSGFNEAFKKYFGGQDPVEFTNGLSEDGKIVIRPMKGGVVLYLPEEAPQVKSRGEEALKKMGLIYPRSPSPPPSPVQGEGFKVDRIILFLKHRLLSLILF